MGLIRVSVTVEPQWTDQTQLWLMIGSEFAPDLAGSTPAGGTVATRTSVGDVAPGGVVVLEHDHRSVDKCATLPVGVLAVDEAGNTSVATEAVVQLADPPAAVPRPDVTAAGPGTVTLTWPASADL